MRASRGGHLSLNLTIDIICAVFLLQDLILQKIESQASRLNSIGKLVSTAKCAAKITPQSKEFHINSFKNAVAHPVSQVDTV